MLQNVKVRLLITVLVVLASAALLFKKQPTLGLDLQGGSHLALTLDESKAQLSPDQRKDALDRAIKVVRMRVDELGVAEPIVQQAGNDRIIVELAGLQGDQQNRAKEVIQKTAFLEFQIVRPLPELQALLPAIDRAVVQTFGASGGEAGAAASPVGGLFQTKDGAKKDSAATGQPFSSKIVGVGNEGQVLVDINQAELLEKYLASPAVQRIMPRGTEMLWGVPAAERQPQFRSLYLVNTRPIMTGAELENAQASTDPQFNRPVVVFELSNRGGRQFEKATGEHINEQMAIVLDQRVYTAPVIRSAIRDRGQIELGNATMAEASDLALVLRAGALPAPLKIAEERSVGASLGEDSIQKGMVAGAVGVVLVILMMIGIYHFSGVLAVVALGVYCLLTVALLALMDATLTFPGIAGLILSVGMAVDANVLIFERTREELDHGRAPRTAVNEGFHHALRAIVDSNMTSLITCAILFYTGTGPIRGFAVTLALGVVASMFTAIFVTRTLFMLYLERRTAAQGISI